MDVPKVTLRYKQTVQDKIVKTAIELFSKNGYRNTKMNDIARIMGISKGKLYLYFQSKEDLFYATCRSYDQLLYKDNDIYYQNVSDISEYFGKIYDHEISLLKQYYPILVDVLAESKHNSYLKNILEKERLVAEQIALHFLQEVQKSGQFLTNSKNLNDLALGVVALYDGLASSRFTGQDYKSNKNAFVTTMAAILKGAS